MWFHVRHDQLILVSIAGLLSLTVIFAAGVERGKRLVRSERLLLPRVEQQIVIPLAAASRQSASAPKAAAVKPAQAPAAAKPVTTASPAAPAKKSAPNKVAGSGSRYAIQVVTFSQPTLARKELQRLQAQGERAFLIMRNGRTVVYVGPFPSKNNASDKLSTLKSTYQDCFLRTL